MRGAGRRALRGLTMPEVIVTAALGLMALGLAFAYLIPAMRASTRGSVRVEMEQQALVAIGKIVQDVQTTNVGGVSLRTGDPTVLALQPLKEVNAEGTQVWSRQVVVYHRDPTTDELFRFEYPATPGGADSLGLALRNSRPRRLPAGVLLSLATLQGVRRVRLATGLKKFEFEHTGGPDGITQPLTVTLSLERKAATGRKDPETFSLSRTLFIRSQR